MKRGRTFVELQVKALPNAKSEITDEGYMLIIKFYGVWGFGVDIGLT